MSDVENHVPLLKHKENEDDGFITLIDPRKNSSRLLKRRTMTKTTSYLWIILPWLLLLLVISWTLFQRYRHVRLESSVMPLLYSKFIGTLLHLLPDNWQSRSRSGFPGVWDKKISARASWWYYWIPGWPNSSIGREVGVVVQEWVLTQNWTWLDIWFLN